MNHAFTSPHRIVLMDLRDTLGGFMSTLADYCDVDYRDGGGMLTEQEILTLTMNFLNIAYNEGEAIEAMGIQINTFCKYLPTEYNKQRIYEAIYFYIKEMHCRFLQAKMYGDDSHLLYTFGGWHCEYCPIFVPYTHIRQYPEAISTIVGSEPVDPRPSRVFYPFINTPDPWATWPLTPKATDVVPY